MIGLNSFDWCGWIMRGAKFLPVEQVDGCRH
jgi:hypothetical protein